VSDWIGFGDAELPQGAEPERFFELDTTPLYRLSYVDRSQEVRGEIDLSKIIAFNEALAAAFTRYIERAYESLLPLAEQLGTVPEGEVAWRRFASTLRYRTLKRLDVCGCHPPEPWDGEA
jgi:hypothetical protein